MLHSCLYFIFPFTPFPACIMTFFCLPFSSFWKLFRHLFLVEVLPGKGHPGDANDASYALYFCIGSAAPGGFPVAEAKDLTVQATTSLPLHGMAELGSRPAPPTFFLTLGKRFLEPRRPLVRAFRRSSGVRPSQAGFSFFREMVLQKRSGCLAGHRGELFQANFGNEGELMKTT